MKKVITTGTDDVKGAVILVLIGLGMAFFFYKAVCSPNVNQAIADKPKPVKTDAYRVVKKSQSVSSGRKRMLAEITVPYKTDWKRIGAITKNALNTLQNMYPDIVFFRANVTFSKHLIGTGNYLAFGVFARDKKGFSGSDRYTWDIQVIPKETKKPTLKELKALEKFWQLEADSPGVISESSLIKQAAQASGLSKQEVSKAVSVIYQPGEVYLHE